VTLRPGKGRVDPDHPQNQVPRDPVVHTAQDARRRVLERAYPLLKRAAEILELEAIEPLAAWTKLIRKLVGSELAGLGQPSASSEQAHDERDHRASAPQPSTQVTCSKQPCCLHELCPSRPTDRGRAQRRGRLQTNKPQQRNVTTPEETSACCGDM
jgi:hypothetical protein